MSKKRIISLIVIGVLLSSASVLATYLIESSDVEFDNTTANIPDANGDETVSVQEAIDYLVNNMSSGSEGASFILDSQGGTQLENQRPDRYAISSLPAPTKEGYYFVGWYDESEGGNRITPETIIDDDTTIYAHWTPVANSFSTDSWLTIQYAVKNNDTTKYNVGDTKTVSVETYGDKTVRIANNSHYDCKVDDIELESKTACGFVVEFTSVVGGGGMNSSKTTSGGWPATLMRSWLNSTLLAKLPSELQSAITDTTVVSGFIESSSVSSNGVIYTSVDKLYFLSPKEVWNSNSNDTAWAKTRQLDYYKNNSAAKTSTLWWLRTAYADGVCFSLVNYSGQIAAKYANESYHASPAFRIG